MTLLVIRTKQKLNIKETFMSEKYNSIPALSVDLIAQLARDIPPIQVKPTDSMSDIMFKGGARDLVDTLLERLKNTNALAIEGEVKIDV